MRAVLLKAIQRALELARQVRAAQLVALRLLHPYLLIKVAV